MSAVTFPSVGTFPTNGTVFLAPTVTDDLLRLHHFIMIISKLFMIIQIHIMYQENGFRIVRLRII